MIVSKAFEVRDRMTCIPVMATELKSDNDQEQWLFWKVGYHHADRVIQLTKLSTGESYLAAECWSKGSRTMHEAHKYIQAHFDELEAGAVVDVEFVLGETKEQKVSERGHYE